MKRFFIAGLTITLAGCSLIQGRDALLRDRANEYLYAESVPRIVLPEGVAPNKDEEDYLPIPALSEDVKKPLPEDFEIPTAPPLMAEDQQTESASLVDLNAFDGAKSAEVGARLIEGENGSVVLQFNKGFDEVWDTVGESLKSAGVKIVDLNRSSETYDIEYDDIPLQLIIKESAGITVVTLLKDKEVAALGLSEEILQKIIDHISRQAE